MMDVKERRESIDREIDASYEKSWNIIKKLGVDFINPKYATNISMERRINILKKLVMYYESQAKYERCAFMMKLLRALGIQNF